MPRRFVPKRPCVRTYSPPRPPSLDSKYVPITLPCVPSSETPRVATTVSAVSCPTITTRPPPSSVHDAPLDTVASRGTCVSASFPNGAPFALPSALLHLGNAAQWRALRERLMGNEAHVPIVLSGPTGCGKSRGVADLLVAMGLHPVVLDAVAADDHDQLMEWIGRARRAVTRTHKNVVVLDDMEGFTQKTRKQILSVSIESRNSTRSAPLILICNNIRDPMWKEIQTLPVIRFRAPNQNTCVEWFARHCTGSYSLSEVLRFQGPFGDLRRMSIALHVFRETKCTRQLSGDVFTDNIFGSTRRLFLHLYTAQQWANDAEPRDVHLLQFHIPKYTTSIDDVCSSFDTLSCLDGMRPSRYEFQHVHDQYVPLCMALSTSLTIRARDVSALHPPPRPSTVVPTGRGNLKETLNRCM